MKARCKKKKHVRKYRVLHRSSSNMYRNKYAKYSQCSTVIKRNDSSNQTNKD